LPTGLWTLFAGFVVVSVVSIASRRYSFDLGVEDLIGHFFSSKGEAFFSRFFILEARFL
jgi:hypothetical protein